MKKILNKIKEILLFPFDKYNELKERKQNKKELEEERKKTKFIYK